MTTFENLLVRQKAEEITLSIYDMMKNIQDWGFKDQIQRASVSIMNNIAEGYERSTEKEKYRYFDIAKSSCAEVRSMIQLGYKLGYCSEEVYTMIKQNCFGLSKMIYVFMKKFKEV